MYVMLLVLLVCPTRKRGSANFSAGCVYVPQCGQQWLFALACMSVMPGIPDHKELYRREEASAGGPAENILFKYVCSAPVTRIMGLKLLGTSDEFHRKGHRNHGALRTVGQKALRGP